MMLFGKKIAAFGNCIRQDGLSSDQMGIEQQLEDSLSKDSDFWITNPEIWLDHPSRLRKKQLSAGQMGLRTTKHYQRLFWKVFFEWKGAHNTVQNSFASALINKHTIERGNCSAKGKEQHGRQDISNKVDGYERSSEHGRNFIEW